MHIQSIETEALPLDTGAFSALFDTIVEARQNIAANFLTIGQALTTIKSRKLYREKGFTSFAAFLQDPRIDIALSDAERFMTLANDPSFIQKTALGLSKMLELLKLPPAERVRLLNEGAQFKGQTKSVEQMNLRELKQASQEIKRRGKSRCDRCGRWVEQVKEIDGRFYGAGKSHSCYEIEMEERRSLSAGRIPAEQLNHVLDTLRFERVQAAPESAPLQWLPESIYQLYGQLLQDPGYQRAEVSAEQLKQEQTTLKKLIHLCQNRLREIQETLEMLSVLENTEDESNSETPPWD